MALKHGGHSSAEEAMQGVLESISFLEQLSARTRVTIHTSHLVEHVRSLYGSSKAVCLELEREHEIHQKTNCISGDFIPAGS